MDRQSPPVNQLSIKQALLQDLQAAVSSYILNTPFLTNRKSYIPLQLSKQKRVIYNCAIAFKLSNLVGLPAMEVAKSISHLLYQRNHQQNLILQIVDPGWIYLELTQHSLAAWLQYWIETLPYLRSQEIGGGENKRTKLIHNSQLTIHNYSPHPTPCALFPIQYAHARCCSLLQMAHREKIMAISSRNTDIISSFLEVISPQPLPWLSEAKICLNRPAELDLLIQLIAVLDDLYCPNPTRQSLNWLKVALNLSQAFQFFYSQCRIWGDIKSQNLNLAQARLGLVAIAQSVFRILLVDVLDSSAPSEL